MYWKINARFAAGHEQREQPRQMWKVAGDNDVAGFTMKAIAKPLRRIVGLQVARR